MDFVTEFCFCFAFFFLFLFLSEMIVDHQIETGLLKPDLKDKVTYTLLRKHRHQTKKSNLRSLADIGKTVSSASRMFTNPDNGNAGADWLLLSLPVSLTFTPSRVIVFFFNPSYFFFSQIHMPRPFHNDTFYPVGQAGSPAGKISAVIRDCKCQDVLLTPYTSILIE